MLFEILGVVSLMLFSSSFAWVVAYERGEERASRMWEERMRALRERVWNNTKDDSNDRP